MIPPRFLILLPLVALLLSACHSPVDPATPALSPETLSDFTVTVEMSSLGLMARAYEIRVDQTGVGEFKGKFGARDFSSVPLAIHQSRVDEIRAAIIASRFFSLPHDYPADTGIVDAGVTRVTVSTPLTTKSVSIQGGSASSRRGDAKLLLDLVDAVHVAVDSAPLLEQHCAWPR